MIIDRIAMLSENNLIKFIIELIFSSYIINKIVKNIVLFNVLEY